MFRARFGESGYVSRDRRAWKLGIVGAFDFNRLAPL